MAKKFLDQIGLSHFWSMILGELSEKANQSNLVSLEDRVEVLETAEFTIYGGSASDVIEKGDD